MKVVKNKEKTSSKFMKGELSQIEVIIPSIADKIIVNSDNQLELDKIIEENIEYKRHEDGLSATVLIYALLSSKLKRLFSITESVLALTAIPIINKFKLNLVSKKEITCESNMRKFIKKIGTSQEISEQKVNQKLKENQIKNQKIKEENKKKSENKDEIKKELQIKQDGHVFVDFFNKVMKKIISKTEKPTIHILDCVKMGVTLKNKKYELSTVINYEGTPMRGYKMGVLRGVTNSGGIIEYLIDGTIADNDLSLVQEEISKYNGFQKGDYLLMDRGFTCIDFIVRLVKKGINVIVPVKKNMDIFKECIKQALTAKEEDWKDHPNSKRKGQKVLLIKNLKGIWVSNKDQSKKPAKMLKNAIDFCACVIRIEKEKNKNVVISADKANKTENDADLVYEDEKYIYLVITSTNTELTAAQIIRYYEMRPEIEEDFRQLKDIWKICTFNSTKYIFVMCQICMTFLAYNLFNIFKNTKQGEKYINKSMRKIANEEQRISVPFHEANYLIVTGSFYNIYTGTELLDLYASCDVNSREKLKHLLSM